MPSHSHTVWNKISSTDAEQLGSGSRDYLAQGNSGTTGSSSSHTHTLSGTASIALNVKYTDVIICSKN